MSNKVEYILSIKDLFSSSLNSAASSADRATASIDRTKNKVGELEGAFNQVKRAAIAFFAVEKVKEFGSAVLDVGSRYEMLQLQFNNLTGSAEKGREVFKNIRQDAMVTPFGVSELAQANAMLMTSGIEAKEARNTVMDLGNAIAFAGKGNDEFIRMAANLQQIKNVGIATAVDIKQFGFAGINIYAALARATGKTTAQVKDMDISYDLLAKTLRAANQQGGIFYGGLSTVANSTSVATSNLADKMNEFYNDIFLRAKPAIDSIINGLSDFIGSLRGSLIWMDRHADGLKAVGVGIASLVTAIIAYNTYSFLMAIRIGGTTVAMIAQSVAAFGLAETWGMLNLAMAANPIGLVIIGLAALSAGIYYAWQKSEVFRGAVMGVFNVVKSLAMPIWDLIKAFKNLFTLDFEGAGNNMKDFFKHEVEGFNYVGNFKKGYNDEVYGTTPVAKLVMDGTGGFTYEQKKKSVFADGPINALRNKKDSTSGVGVGASTSGADKVSGTRATNIYINIGKLIETQKITVENAAKDFTNRLHDEVAKIYLSVVNDASRIGGQ